MEAYIAQQLADSIEKIKTYKVTVEKEAKRLRSPELAISFDNQNAKLWCLSVVGDSLIRIRLLIEQNFQVVETLGVVAVSRYLFELSIWLKLFGNDDRYGLIYYDQLIETQKNYYQSTLRQFQREIEFLRDFEVREKEETDEIFATKEPGKALMKNIKSVADSIDKEAARRFSIYAKQAKYNGYGYQAYLVEKKSIPPIELALSQIDVERKNFDGNILPIISDLAFDKNGKRKRWKWNEMAKEAGLQNEYDYIYAFSSKLLHATPASITTNQKNLEPEEMLIFLRYIEVKLSDIIEISSRYSVSCI